MLCYILINSDYCSWTFSFGLHFYYYLVLYYLKKRPMFFFAQAHVCSDSIYFGQPSVIVYIVNIIVNDTKIIIFQQCFLSFLCKSGRKTDKAKLYIPSTINTDYLLWQFKAKIDSFHNSICSSFF